jgi:transposase-like protein
MTRKDSNKSVGKIKALLGQESDFLRPMVRTVIQEFLEAEMAEAGGAR